MKVSCSWAILLYGLGISGGANVIFEHALYAVERGVDVTFITLQRIEQSDVSWHRGTEKFRYLTLDESAKETYDVAIATEWKSAFDIYMINADKYIYFVQSIESRFFKDKNDLLAYIADNSYEIGFSYITEATWIKEYLKKKYNKDATLVLNGINKKLFCTAGKTIESREPEKVRFLIEGPVSNWLKNVPQTIKLCRDAGVEELWLVTSDEMDQYPGVDRVFSRVSFENMPEIYRSCDVLVKLSLVEGMFGPPLEMFHCGGTCIVYDIEGAEEYISDGYNSLVVKKDDENGVIDAIKLLKTDLSLLDKLKRGAVETAYEWNNWDESSSAFFQAVNIAACQTSEEIGILTGKAESGAGTYRTIEKLLGRTTTNDRVDLAIDLLNKSNKKLAIYGAGNYCRSTIMRFACYDVIIDCIVVTNTDNNPNAVLGHPVVSIDQLESDKENYVVYISTEKAYRDIKELLIEKGFRYIV